ARIAGLLVSLWAAHAGVGSCRDSRRWAGHHRESEPAGLLPQSAFLLSSRDHRDAVVPRSGTGAPRHALCGAGTQRRHDSARWPRARMVDGPRQNGSVFCRVFQTRRTRIAAMGGRISPHRGKHFDSRSAIAAAATGAPTKILAIIKARPAIA